MPIRRLSKPHYTKSKKSHARLDSSHTPLMPGSNTPVAVPPQLHHDPDSQLQISKSTSSAKSSPRNRLRPARSNSSAESAEGNHSVAPSYNNLDFLPVNEDIRDSGHFRSIISQIARETEEGLAFARSEDTSSSSKNTVGSSSRGDSPNLEPEDPHHQYNYHDDEDDFYAASPARALSEGDYRQPYPADEHVLMMNAYVKRMPTIESMGSREMRSSLGAPSLNTNRDRNRPPTRNTLRSWAGSDFSEGETRSRPNSLTAQAELLAGMFSKSHTSEIGELLQRGEAFRTVDSQFANSSEALAVEYASSSSGSKKTGISYHSAATSSPVNSALALADATLPILAGDDSEPLTLAKQEDS